MITRATRLPLAATLLLGVSLAGAAVETTTITGKLYVPGGGTATGGTITAILSSSGSTEDAGVTQIVAGRVSTTIGATGAVSFALVPNDAITPSGTSYTVNFAVTAPIYMSWMEKWNVLTAPDPVEIGDVQRLTTPATASGMITKEAGATVVSPTGSVDFGAGFDVSKAGYEADVVLDLSEYTTGGLLPFSMLGTGTITGSPTMIVAGSALLIPQSGGTIRSNDVNCTTCVNPGEINKTTTENPGDSTSLNLGHLVFGTPTNAQVVGYNSAADRIDWISATGVNAFGTIDTPTGTDPVADQANDTLILQSNNAFLAVVGDASNDSVSFNVGTLSTDKGGTGGTASPTDDAALIGDGANKYDPKVIPDCDVVGKALLYDQGTNAFSCGEPSSNLWVTTGIALNSGSSVYADFCQEYRATLPVKMTTDTVRFYVAGASASAVISVGVYSLDGQTRFIACTGVDVSAGGDKSCAFAPVTLHASGYVIRVCSNGGGTVTLYGVGMWLPMKGASSDVACTGCGATLPATITPQLNTGQPNSPSLVFED